MKHEVADEVEMVYRGGGGVQRGILLRSVIEGSGIECFLRESGAAGMYPTNVGALGEFELWVHAVDAERARAILSELEDT